MSFWKTALGIVTAAYTQDVIVRPEQVAKVARAYCDRVGKPLLNVGAGTPQSSLRALILGPTLWGDVNIDKFGAKMVPHGRGRVTYGDAHDLRAWGDRHFGAVIASHVLEHVERPDAALAEWRRVADTVFVVVPPWWAPHTWLHPGHRWYIDSDLKAAYPVWTDRDRIYLLPVSDKRYGRGRWATKTSQQPFPNPETTPNLSPNSPSSQSQSSRLSPPSRSTQSEQATEEEANLGTGASNSVSTLVVISGQKSDSS